MSGQTYFESTHRQADSKFLVGEAVFVYNIITMITLPQQTFDQMAIPLSQLSVEKFQILIIFHQPNSSCELILV